MVSLFFWSSGSVSVWSGNGAVVQVVVIRLGKRVLGDLRLDIAACRGGPASVLEGRSAAMERHTKYRGSGLCVVCAPHCPLAQARQMPKLRANARLNWTVKTSVYEEPSGFRSSLQKIPHRSPLDCSIAAASGVSVWAPHAGELHPQ